MIISHKKKFVFIHIPKTGGTSVNEIIAGKADVFNPSLKGHAPKQLQSFKDNGVWPLFKHWKISEDLTQHASVSKVHSYFKEVDWKWNDYFKFTVVRNPYSWAVSTYFYFQQKIKTGNIVPINQEKVLAQFGNKSFREFVMANSHSYMHRIIPKNGARVDFAVRLEHFQKDFNVVCDRIGVPPQQLPHANKSKHQQYTEYYDDETREVIAKKCKKELEFFGYEFGQ